jgi:hypothetical protein
MSSADGTVAALQGAYFFLSYAPAGRASEGSGDPSISTFFDDLCKSISDRVDGGGGQGIGFFDERIARGGDLKSEVSSALRAAQVLVPLYSPRYFTSRWSMREHEAFQRRLDVTGTAAPERHVVPVIWTPFLAPQDRAEWALRSGPADRSYQENGLRALHMLPSYRSSYRRVVGWLADRIVTVTREQPLRPSRAPELDDVEPRATLGPRFVLTMLSSPATATRTVGTEGGSDWWEDLSAGTHQSVLAYASTRVERMGLAPVVVPSERIAHESRENPAVMLVDPWIVADAGEGLLRDVAESLPRWGSPLLLSPSGGPGRSRDHELAAAAGRILAEVRRARTPQAGSRAQLAGVLPPLIATLRREYLRYGRVFPPPGPARPRPPRLGDSRTRHEENDSNG